MAKPIQTKPTKQTLVALKKISGKLKAGDTFVCGERDARAFIKAGLARVPTPPLKAAMQAQKPVTAETAETKGDDSTAGDPPRGRYRRRDLTTASQE